MSPAHSTVQYSAVQWCMCVMSPAHNIVFSKKFVFNELCPADFLVLFVLILLSV
jgi:hypothetical protein